MGTFATTTALATMMPGISFSASTTAATADKCVSRAEARVKSVLARRYDLASAYFSTSTSIPPQVREWTEQMGEGFLWQALSRGGAGQEAMKRGKGLIDGVMDDLKLLAEFELDLCDTAGSVILDMSDTSSRVLCNTRDYTPTFDEGDELGWVADPDKLEDIADAKD